MTHVVEAPDDRAEPSGRGGMTPIDLRRRWIVITVATVVMQFAWWPTLAGIATASGEDSTFALGLFALGLSLVPAAFLALAFGSNHPRAAGATLRAMGLFLLVSLPVVSCWTAWWGWRQGWLPVVRSRSTSTPTCTVGGGGGSRWARWSPTCSSCG